MYFNGAEPSTYLNTTNGSGSRNSGASQNLFIGASTFGTQNFDGFIDDVRIYNRALTVSDISTLYALGSLETLKMKTNSLSTYPLSF